MYAVSFQSAKGYDVAVDPHMLEFYHSQIEDIEIQGKLHTQQQLLDFENHFEAVSSGNIVDIALAGLYRDFASSRLLETPFL